MSGVNAFMPALDAEWAVSAGTYSYYADGAMNTSHESAYIRGSTAAVTVKHKFGLVEMIAFCC